MNVNLNKSIKDALHATIHKHPIKSVAAIAEEIGMSENYLYRAALPDQDMDGQGTGCRFPLKGIIPLIRATDDFQVLDYIEMTLGRVAIKLPVCSASLGEVSRGALRAAAEFGELMAQTDKSLDDGDISPCELAKIEKEGYEAVQAIINMICTARESVKK